MSAWEVPALLAWLRRTAPRFDVMGPFELLELSPTDDEARIQDAYHAIATTRHPDRFRGKLAPADAELLMTVFGRISGAYALLRDPAQRQKLVPRRSGALAAQRPTPPAGTTTSPAGASATPSTGTPVAPRPIGPKAKSYVRRAEAALDAGDAASALLNLRMAVAAEPGSRELRQLLADTEANLKKPR